MPRVYISKRTICTVPECGRAEYAKGLCLKHYNRLRRAGTKVLKREMPKVPKPKCSIEGCDTTALQVKSHKYPYPMCGKHIYRFKKYGKALAQIHKPNHMGYEGEESVNQLLMQNGHATRRARYGENFDLLVDDCVRVEIKCSQSIKDEAGRSQWQFNIHRHGILKEDADVYILRLEKIPESKTALHALFPAPLGKPTMKASIRVLLGSPKWHKALADFREFCRTETQDMHKWKRAVADAPQGRKEER